MGRVSELHKKWSKNPEYRSAYDELGPEFEIARLLIGARLQAGLTQAQLAERIQTTQSAVARFESGRIHPSTNTLKKIAQATGTRLKISFEAIKQETIATICAANEAKQQQLKRQQAKFILSLQNRTVREERVALTSLGFRG